MTDKNYCMSSYLAFRYIERPDADFYPGMHHRNFVPVPDSERTRLPRRTRSTGQISAQLERLRGQKSRDNAFRRDGFGNRCLVYARV